MVQLGCRGFATLCPIAVRPHISNNSYIEHFSAFAIIGLLFCLTYPRQTFLISVVVLGSTTLLEVMQFLTHDRHGRISDLEFKLAGAIVRIAAGESCETTRYSASLTTPIECRRRARCPARALSWPSGFECGETIIADRPDDPLFREPGDASLAELAEFIETARTGTETFRFPAAGLISPKPPFRRLKAWPT